MTISNIIPITTIRATTMALKSSKYALMQDLVALTETALSLQEDVYFAQSEEAAI